MFGLVPFRKNLINSNVNSFDNFISNFFNDDFLTSSNMMGNFKADIKETPNEYIIDAELPGIKKEDITIDYKNNYLTVSANRQEVIEENNDNYIRKERHYGNFSRSFYIDDIDKISVNARFDNGILSIVLPKLNNKFIDNSTRIRID
ncbi:Hsp20/alpha crystallin family protein [Clostridium ihumii]|uniref:Hsp20/alpha crystallin family protein n=1 Tax=Clostridium ihumii TaxID=1470356 RepID=UPI0005905D16|nr:Hsp20/alpha crystallin family protein [Clostridium ihumii]